MGGHETIRKGSGEVVWSKLGPQLVPKIPLDEFSLVSLYRNWVELFSVFFVIVIFLFYNIISSHYLLNKSNNFKIYLVVMEI